MEKKSKKSVNHGEKQTKSHDETCRTKAYINEQSMFKL